MDSLFIAALNLLLLTNDKVIILDSNTVRTSNRDYTSSYLKVCDSGDYTCNYVYREVDLKYNKYTHKFTPIF